MEEQWRHLEGADDYEVSSKGRVRRVLSPGVFFVLKLTPKPTGYIQINLRHRGMGYPRVNRLVAEAFIPNPDRLPFVNHLDGVKWNNESSNLEWCTASHNMKHAHATGLQSIVGTKHPQARFTDDQIREVRKTYEDGALQTKLATVYGVSPSTIQAIVTRRSWAHI